MAQLSFYNRYCVAVNYANLDGGEVVSDVLLGALSLENFALGDESDDFVGLADDGFRTSPFLLVAVGVAVEAVKDGHVIRDVIRALAGEIGQQGALHSQLLNPLYL